MRGTVLVSSVMMLREQERFSSELRDLGYDPVFSRSFTIYGRSPMPRNTPVSSTFGCLVTIRFLLRS